MKTTTDQHWNERALSVASDADVNLMDVFQRRLELEEIGRWLQPEMTVLEVGCGNGFSTHAFRSIVQHVDAFDYAESMIERAKRDVGETNNRFFHDNVVEPKDIDREYDAVICVRVLINLASLDQQQTAIRNMARFTRPGGVLILAEGFQDGFAELSGLRERVGLPPISPASINVYSSLDDLRPTWRQAFDVEDEWHLGAYDYLTRVVYPLIAAPDEVRHNTVFSERSARLAAAFNPESFRELSRMRGFLLRKR